jgi:hypothetical protein
LEVFLQFRLAYAFLAFPFAAFAAVRLAGGGQLHLSATAAARSRLTARERSSGEQHDEGGG